MLAYQSLPVIQMLPQAYPNACDIQDVYGKTSLTLTCDAACELFEGDRNSYEREHPSFQVVKALLEASGVIGTIGRQPQYESALEQHSLVTHQLKFKCTPACD